MPDPIPNALVRQRMTDIAEKVVAELPDGALFCLFVFTNQTQDDDAVYVSNAEPASVAEALRKIAARLESRARPPSDN